jgi:hypothetical protein
MFGYNTYILYTHLDIHTGVSHASTLDFRKCCAVCGIPSISVSLVECWDKLVNKLRFHPFKCFDCLIVPSLTDTVLSESRCASRLRYIDQVVGVEAAFEVCCFFVVFGC